MLRMLVAVATVVATGVLIATTALADLRSPEGTAALGTTLADDPAVRTLVATTLVDALLDDATASAPDVAALLPLVRPLLASATDAALDAPAGRAALAATLTDAARQLTFPGPIVLDLSDAVLAAADAAPEPLATLARTAVGRGAVGTIVLGAAEDGAVVEPPDDAMLSRVGGLTASTATTLAWVLLGVVLLAAAIPGGAARPARIRACGGALLLVGVPATLVLRLAPELLVDRVAGRLEDAAASGLVGGDVDLVTAVVPALVDGMAGLVTRTADVALLVAAAGVVLVVVGVVLRLVPGRR